MRWFWAVAVALAISAPAICADRPPIVPLLPCSAQQNVPATCAPTKDELKHARAAFSRGLKLQNSRHLDEAFDEFEMAARLSPRNLNYLTAREMIREQLTFDHLQQGNAALLAGRQVEALGEFRSALHLDPGNAFAQQRLAEALNEWAPTVASKPSVVADSGEVQVAPKPEQVDIHYRGDVRGLFAQIASVFGLSAVFDDSVVERRVRFDIGKADFRSALQAACDVTHTFWSPLSGNEILLAADTTENHRQFDHMALRTFFVPGVSAPADLTTLVSLLRAVFDIKFIIPQAQSSTLTIRAPQEVLEAATQLLEELDEGRPEVMLDVKVYDVSSSLTRNMGLQIPNQFNLYNIPAGALAALGGQNIQQLINELISNGGINQANSQALSGLLGQLTGQQNSIFSQPLATFGNGLTLMGLSLGTAGAQLSLNQSDIRTLNHAMFRVVQGGDATFRMGTRYPILNATFAPIFNTAAIAQVIQNNTFQAPFPSITYEDLGLTVKAKPVINTHSIVGLQMELQLRTLTAQQLNGVPVIANREYKGTINLNDGEPAVVAGAVTRNEQLSLSGIPGLGQVPGLNQIMTSNSKEVDTDELLIMITPHIVNRTNEQDSLVMVEK